VAIVGRTTTSRGRPGWPAESVRIAGPPATAIVLDLGAGTGKLTRLLVSAFDRVVAVEPADVRLLGDSVLDHDPLRCGPNVSTSRSAALAGRLAATPSATCEVSALGRCDAAKREVPAAPP
jgi:hypothetical protein